MQVGAPVAVAQDARGEFWGGRVGGRRGVAVDRRDRANGRERDLIFVRFEKNDGTILFFDWVPLDDLRAA